MPDPNKVLALVRRATMLSRATPGRRGGIVELSDADDVLAVGDLHGNLPAFRRILALADLRNHPRRHLVLQELVHGEIAYPDDGGDKSHQLVDLVSALKCEIPDRVHLILGNHELSELTGRPIAKNGASLIPHFRRGIETAYGSRAREVNQAYQELFRSLPLAVRTPNRVFLCHTIPDASHLDSLDLDILRTGVWPPESLRRGGTVYAMTWGRDTQPETVDRFAGMVDADLFVTGHQPCDDSYRQPNHRQIIIDGTGSFPAFCLFSAIDPMTIETLRAGIRVLDLVGD